MFTSQKTDGKRNAEMFTANLRKWSAKRYKGIFVLYRQLKQHCDKGYFMLIIFPYYKIGYIVEATVPSGFSRLFHIQFSNT